MHRVGALWSRTALLLSGVRVKVSGIENIPEGTFILAANHSGAFDIPVLQACVPRQFRWVAKRSLFNIPVFGWAMTFAGYIPIDRGNPKAMVRSIDRGAEKIKAGTSVVIFPEGTRNPYKELLPFKKGAFLLAIRSRAPVVPVSITGTRDIMTRGSMVIRPAEVCVLIGDPIDSTGLDEEALMKLVRESIEAGLNHIQGKGKGL